MILFILIFTIYFIINARACFEVSVNKLFFFYKAVPYTVMSRTSRGCRCVLCIHLSLTYKSRKLDDRARIKNYYLPKAFFLMAHFKYRTCGLLARLYIEISKMGHKFIFACHRFRIDFSMPSTSLTAIITGI